MYDKLNLTALILTYNEHLHIKRCIESCKQYCKDVVVIDSFSTDDTVEIAKSLGARVYQNKWENNYAKQFNWGLDSGEITTEWVIRMDADEYCLPELIEEIKEKLPNVSDDVSGIILKRRSYFWGKWMKHGIYPVKLLRLFRYSQGRCENRWMDEHIFVKSGNVIEFENDFVDENLNNVRWWVNKHVNYAIREAVDLLDIQYGLTGNNSESSGQEKGGQADKKRELKRKYANMPLFKRAVNYFLYRYFIKGAWRDGKEALAFTIVQGLWYRILVDCYIYEIKHMCGTDIEKMKKYISENYNLNIA